jgi:DNA modification methylase
MIQVIQHRWPQPLSIPPCDLIFCDPPYNFGVAYEDDDTNDHISNYREWMGDTVLRLDTLLRPGGTLWWLCPSAHMDFVPHAIRSIGLILYRIVKQETFAQYQQKTLTDDYRMLFCCQKSGGPLAFNPGAIRIPSDRQEKYNDPRANPAGRVPGQVWKVRRLQGTSKDHVDWHPCQLPPELLTRVVDGWTNIGDTVLDAFAGSGSMGRVCKALDRNCILVDQSPTYCEKLKQEFL